MIDTYLASDDEAALRAFCGFFSQVIGPERGRDGVGDPEKFYACIRAPFPIQSSDGIIVVPAEEGASVVGVWA